MKKFTLYVLTLLALISSVQPASAQPIDVGNPYCRIEVNRWRPQWDCRQWQHSQWEQRRQEERRLCEVRRDERVRWEERRARHEERRQWERCRYYRR